MAVRSSAGRRESARFACDVSLVLLCVGVGGTYHCVEVFGCVCFRPERPSVEHPFDDDGLTHGVDFV